MIEMKQMILLPLCALLFLTACNPVPADPEPTEPTTESETTVETSPTQPTTQAATLPPETVPAELPTEAATTVEQAPTKSATTVEQSPTESLTLPRDSKPPLYESAIDTITGEKAPNPTPYGSPSDEFVYLLLDTVYIAAYWGEDVRHVIPMPAYKAQMEAEVKRLGLDVIVDDPDDFFEEDETMYSQQEQNERYDYLREHAKELGIASFEGANIDHLGRVVISLADDTESNRKKVLDASPVKAIAFVPFDNVGIDT
jgi:hypothetical protein